MLLMAETGLKPMNVRDAVTSFPANPKIGFIGLGNMGAALAMRLLDPGLMVYDPDQTVMKPFVDGGAIVAADLVAMAKQCDIIFACLPTSAVTESVLFGDDGMSGHMKAGQIFIDMTSGDPAMSRDQATRLKQAGIDFVDAPVSGGPRGRARRGDCHYGWR
jgi:3-hydroxyisobutyrate dehydrogenase